MLLIWVVTWRTRVVDLGSLWVLKQCERLDGWGEQDCTVSGCKWQMAELKEALQEYRKSGMATLSVKRKWNQNTKYVELELNWFDIKWSSGFQSSLTDSAQSFRPHIYHSYSEEFSSVETLTMVSPEQSYPAFISIQPHYWKALLLDLIQNFGSQILPKLFIQLWNLLLGGILELLCFLFKNVKW